MKRLIYGIVLFALALLVAGWRLPASFVAGVLVADTSRFVQLHQVSGTVWAGHAQLTVTGIAPTQTVSWACRPSLAALGVRCELRESITGSLSLNTFNGSLQGQQLSTVLPLQLISAGIEIAQSPRVVATLESVSMSRSGLAFKGTLRASEARYRLGQTDVLLGELSADCMPSADNASTACALSNRGGSARVEGNLNLTSVKASGTIVLTSGNGVPQRISF